MEEPREYELSEYPFENEALQVSMCDAGQRERGWGVVSLLSAPRVIGGRGIVPGGAVGVVSAVRHRVYLVAVKVRADEMGSKGMKMGTTEGISSGFC